MFTGGTYNDQKNLTSETQCKTCPAGYFCPEASINPEDCPAGFWCTGGQSTGFQNSCPIGTYSPDMNLHSTDQFTLSTKVTQQLFHSIRHGERFYIYRL